MAKKKQPKKRRSKFEQDVEKQLPKGTKYEAERYSYMKSGTYIPDFFLPNGIILEAKGRFLSSDRTKHKLIQQQWPTLDIRFIFQRDNTLSKKSKTTYTEWCNQHGFKCAVKTVPKTWLTTK